MVEALAKLQELLLEFGDGETGDDAHHEELAFLDESQAQADLGRRAPES